jgi:hypothetical protein
MKLRAAYPTPEHERAAQAIVDFFASRYQPDAVVLVNSCARGKASPDSCLDMNVLFTPERLRADGPALQRAWEQFWQSAPQIESLRRAGRFAEVHLDLIDGDFFPQERDEAAGPDGFELGVGNFLAYSVPLWQSSDYFDRLQRRWLPFYDEILRQERLQMVRGYCLNNLRHVPWFVSRGLYFQAFDRLYNGYQEFLQALFIARRVYPIAYNKWIHEQIVEVLGLPALYRQIVQILEIHHFESDEISLKAQQVVALLEEYAPAPPL